LIVREYREDLPAVSISRLRALGVITVDTTECRVRIGHVEKIVSIHLRKFPSGGSWSWFGCPTCGKWSRKLLLHRDDIICSGCCKRRGIWPRSWPMRPWQRAEHRIAKLKAMLDSKESLRLKPHLLGTMEKRKRHEAALRRAEFIVAQHDYLGKPGKPGRPKKVKKNAVHSEDAAKLSRS
jgi:hypothetical protein